MLFKVGYGSLYNIGRNQTPQSLYSKGDKSKLLVPEAIDLFADMVLSLSLYFLSGESSDEDGSRSVYLGKRL